MRLGYTFAGMVVVASGCMAGDLASYPWTEDGERIPASDGTTLAPLEELLPEPTPHATALKNLTKTDADTADILVYGDFAPGKDGLIPVLAELGHSVTESDLLPADLEPFDTVFRVSTETPLDPVESATLADFLAAGGGVHLSGERPCTACVPMNDSLSVFVNDVVKSGGLTVGRQGDIDPNEGNGPFPYPLNPDARGGITLKPHFAQNLFLPNPGGIAGIAASENVLAFGSEGTPVGAVWEGADLVGGAGKLVLVMDVNWFQALNYGDNMVFVQNLQEFVQSQEPAVIDIDGDGVPADIDCNDDDNTVGALLFEDDFTEDSGFFTTPAVLGSDWDFADGVTSAPADGLQSQLGESQDWSNVVVFATIAAKDPQAECGINVEDAVCEAPDTWRAGVLVRAAADQGQAHGFNGYRCALAYDAVSGCHTDVLSLEIGEFRSSADSEAAKSSFDLHGRHRQGRIDLAAGETGSLTFYAVDNKMYCEASNETGEFVYTSGVDDSLASGTVGLTTLNLAGMFDDIRVCEALAMPY